MSIEHDLPLSMILMGEPLANYVKSLDCRCELASETRTNTGNELLLRIKYRHHIFKLNSFEISNFNLFIFRLCEWTTTKNIYSNSFVFVRVSVKLVFFEKYSKNKYTQLFPKIFFPDECVRICSLDLNRWRFSGLRIRSGICTFAARYLASMMLLVL